MFKKKKKNVSKVDKIFSTMIFDSWSIAFALFLSYLAVFLYREVFCSSWPKVAHKKNSKMQSLVEQLPILKLPYKYPVVKHLFV
jgi:hypothetical protein